MPNANTPTNPHEDRLQEAVAAYLQAVDAGQTPNRDAWLARYPDLASELTAFLDSQQRLHRLLPSEASPTATAIPDGVGDYELLGELGRGGMGVVYKARQKALNRLVALKMILAGPDATPLDLQRFRTEAEAAAALDHPNLVPIYDVGEHDGRPFFSMKLIEGEPLEAYLRRPPGDCPLLPRVQRRAAEIVAAVARAVHFAHQKGFLHRDLKPANILLGAGGQPHVADFGLARRVLTPETDAGLTISNGVLTSLTQTGAVVGTPAYMAPEQAVRGPRLGPAADVYGLGAIFYHLLTGQAPFLGLTAEDVLRQVREHTPAPPRHLNPRLDRDLEAICLRCLRKEPHERYGSAQALADDLDRWLAGEATTARRPGPVERVVRWVRRRPAVASLAVAVVVVALVGFGMVVWKWRDALLAERAALEARDTANAARVQAQAAATEAADARKLTEEQAGQTRAQLERAEAALYMNRIAMAWREVQGRDYARAEELLDGCRWDLRNWEHRYLWTLCRRGEVTLNGHTAPVVALACTADGRYLASATGKMTGVARSGPGEGIVWDPTSGRRLFTVPDHAATFQALAFSPAPKPASVWILATAEGNVISLWEVPSGRLLGSLAGHSLEVQSLAFSPDGKHLISSAGNLQQNGEVRVWDVAARAEVRNFIGRDPLRARPAAFPVGGTRFLQRESTRFFIRDWASGEEVRSGSLPGGVGALALSPDGKHLGLLQWDGGPGVLLVLDVLTGNTITRVRIEMPERHTVSFSPDGTLLAFPWRHGVRVLDAATGRSAATLQGHAGPVYAAIILPGGRLATAGDDCVVRLRDQVARPDDLILPDRSWTAGQIALSPDGVRLATTTRILPAVPGEKKIRNVVYVTNTITGEQITAYPGHQQLALALAFAPEGRRVASGGGDRTVQVWDAVTGETLRKIEVGKVAHRLAFSPDGARLAGCGADPNGLPWMTVWNADDGQEVLRLPPQPPVAPSVLSVNFSPDGRRLAVARGNRGKGNHQGVEKLLDPGNVQILDAVSGNELLRLAGHTAATTTVAYSPDGRRIATASQDRTLRLWDADSGRELRALPVAGDREFTVNWSGDGKRLILAADDPQRSLVVLDADSGLELLAFERGDRLPHSMLAVSANGRRIVTVESESHVRIRDASVNPESFTFRGHTGPVRHVAWSPDGKRLASCASIQDATYLPAGGELKIWDTVQGSQLASFKEQSRGTNFVAWSPDGKQLATAGVDGKGRIRDAATGELVAELLGHTEPLTGIAWSPDGRRAVTSGYDGMVKVWEARQGKEVWSVKAAIGPLLTAINAVAYSPDGQRIASVSLEMRVRLWDASTGREVRELSSDSLSLGLAFSHDGARLACGGTDGKVGIREVATGNEVLVLGDRQRPVSGVSFSPDDRLLAAARGPDGIFVWDATTGQEVKVFQGHWAPVRCVAFSPDGRRLASASADRTVKVWTMPER